MQEDKNRDYSNEEINNLVIEARNGSSRAIEKVIRYFTPYILKISNKYYIEGGDRDDIIQEGNIALVNAIRTFNENSTASFKTYMTSVINRQLINAVTSANRLKHQPLNQAILFSTPLDNDENTDLTEIIGENKNDPQSIYESKESLNEYNNQINESLSILEYTILNEVLKGHSYDSIAKKIGKDSKSIDNAIQRIRKKLSKVLY